MARRCTRAKAAQAGQTLDWGPTDLDAKPIVASNFVAALAARYGFERPPMVYQGGAILVTTPAAARAAGVPQDRIVYVWRGARANEPDDFLKRFQAPPWNWGLARQDIDVLGFYSCFRTVPKMARRTLGLGADVQPSVTGGLTFFFGPAINYMTHAITAAVRRIRAGDGDNALLYG